MGVIIEGIHDCPRGVVVSRVCLGFTTTTRIAGIEVFVSLPERGPAPADDWRSSDIVLEAPKWTYMAATKKWSDVYPDEAADEIWGRPKEPDTAVIRRFRFAFEVDDGGEAQAVVNRIAVGMREWWPRVESWIDVLTDQSTPRRPRGARGARGEGTASPTPGPAQHSTAQDYRTFTWPQLPLTAMGLVLNFGRSRWARVMELAADGPPPLERLLLRDARLALEAGEFRLAVIDGGTAVEMSLATLNDQLVSRDPAMLGGASRKVRDARKKSNPTLGDQITVFHGLGGTGASPSLLSLDSLKDDLLDKRNLVTHRLAGAQLTEEQTRTLFAVVASVVERLCPRAALSE